MTVFLDRYTDYFSLEFKHRTIENTYLYTAAFCGLLYSIYLRTGCFFHLLLHSRNFTLNFITLDTSRETARNIRGRDRTMSSIHDLKANDDVSDGKTTHIKFASDSESEAQREAYRIASRGGRIRERVEDVNELYAQLTPLLASVLFEDDPVPLMDWLDLDEDDWDRYQD
jgi:hypothetical protein